MFKKSLFMLIALAMVATTVMIPMASSAEGISDSLCFNVDFKDGSCEETTGNYTLGAASLEIGDGVSFETDSELNRQVAVFEGYGPLVYQSKSSEALNGYDLTKGITLEAYVYLNEVESEYNPVFIETAGSSLHLMQYNSGSDHSVGFRCGDATAAGEGGDAQDAGYKMRNAYRDGALEDKKWVHLVGTSNGDVNQFYVDGQLVATEKRVSSALRTVNNNTSTDIFIGESYFNSMWGVTALEGKVAFARMYKAYADETTVNAMYKATIGGEDIDPTTSPTGDPTTSPTGDPAGSPTNTPSGSPTNKPTNKPTDKPTDSNNGGKAPNTQTFDLGLVSLAAVALSSAVAIKKRK